MTVSTQDASRGVAVVGGTLIDGTGRTPVRDSVVLARDGRFLEVGPAGEVTVPAGWDVIDARNRWVVPGLFDAHAHVTGLLENRFDVEDDEALAEDFLRLFVENGVTTVRCTGGPSLGSSFSTLKQGRPVWPRFFGSGPNLDGPPGGPWPGLRVVETVEEARRQTRELAEGGADFIKVYVWMSAEVMRAVCETAHEFDLPVAGHVGHVVTVEEAVRSGIDALEHVRVGPELLDDSDRARVARLPARRHDHLISFRPWRYADPRSDRARALIDLMASQGVFFTPTLCLSETILRAREERVRRPRGLDRMAPAVVARWEGSDYAADYSEEDLAAAETEMARQLDFIGAAHAGGVRIVAGTDTPNPYIVPGFSMHEELRLLTEAGLSASDALSSATLACATLLGRAGDLGTVEVGRVADLVVLGGDPLADVTATRDVRTVLKDGGVVFGEPPPRDAGEFPATPAR